MLTIAVSKGRLFAEFLRLLDSAGYKCDITESSRKLVIESHEAGLQFVLAKPSDVPTYVEYGATDLGVVGKDTLLESEKDVAELLDLGYGKCQMVVAVPKTSGVSHPCDLDIHSRVATKYPHIAAEYFNKQGIQVDIIPLNGSIELGPLVGLSEAIVDITETGTTLAENGLVVIAKVTDCSCRLVANRVSYKVKRREIEALRNALEAVV